MNGSSSCSVLGCFEAGACKRILWSWGVLAVLRNFNTFYFFQWARDDSLLHLCSDQVTLQLVPAAGHAKRIRKDTGPGRGIRQLSAAGEKPGADLSVCLSNAWADPAMETCLGFIWWKEFTCFSPEGSHRPAECLVTAGRHWNETEASELRVEIPLMCPLDVIQRIH